MLQLSCALIPEGRALSAQAGCGPVPHGFVRSLLKQGRVKVASACTLTLHLLVFRGLSFAELNFLEGREIPLGTLTLH